MKNLLPSIVRFSLSLLCARAASPTIHLCLDGTQPYDYHNVVPCFSSPEDGREFMRLVPKIRHARAAVAESVGVLMSRGTAGTNSRLVDMLEEFFGLCYSFKIIEHQYFLYQHNNILRTDLKEFENICGLRQKELTEQHKGVRKMLTAEESKHVRVRGEIEDSKDIGGILSKKHSESSSIIIAYEIASLEMQLAPIKRDHTVLGDMYITFKFFMDLGETVVEKLIAYTEVRCKLLEICTHFIKTRYPPSDPVLSDMLSNFVSGSSRPCSDEKQGVKCS